MFMDNLGLGPLGTHNNKWGSLGLGSLFYNIALIASIKFWSCR